VEWPDAPRELSDVEREFMYEPGPFAGDAYDEGQVIEAVLAMEPGTAQEWQMAIRSQIQGDYAEDLKVAITFDPSIGDTSEGPTEGTAPEKVAVGTNHFALVLDASGSMDEESGSGTRMAEAKEALTGFVDSLPEDSTISLRVYGHEGDNTVPARTRRAPPARRSTPGRSTPRDWARPWTRSSQPGGPRWPAPSGMRPATSPRTRPTGSCMS
jgi:Ca-activated chloride channel family protein